MDAEITIIGAGVVGLAIAEKLSGEFSDVFVMEKHLSFGQETSSRNSEVIHAGIYYPGGSLKSLLCVEGKALLYDYCRNYNIPHNNCGKLIVATSEEDIPVLKKIRETATNNGVKDLLELDKNQVAEMEPQVYSLMALYSPSTGIVDTHSLMKRLETNTINNGGIIAYGNEVTSIKNTGKGFRIDTRDHENKAFTFTSRIVINSAGLNSDFVAGMAGMYDDNLKIHFCKGEYFKLNPPKNQMIKRLIYPVPLPNLEGVGIHATIDMRGNVKFGPDVTYLESNFNDYSVTKEKQMEFYISVKKYLPFLEFKDISPEMAGIRPKIQKKGSPVRDFYIREERERGNPGFINLIGIESPGLTSCLAIAKHVRTLLPG